MLKCCFIAVPEITTMVRVNDGFNLTLIFNNPEHQRILHDNRCQPGRRLPRLNKTCPSPGLNTIIVVRDARCPLRSAYPPPDCGL